MVLRRKRSSLEEKYRGTRIFSEKTAIEIDEEIKAIVSAGMAKAERILKENIDLLHKLSLELLEREILDSDEIDKIIRGEDLPPFVKNGLDNGSSPQEIPDHVKKLLEQRQSKESTPKDDSN